MELFSNRLAGESRVFSLPPKAQPAPGNAQAKGLRGKRNTLESRSGQPERTDGERAGIKTRPNLSGSMTEGGQIYRIYAGS
jgi:hypothetical protein